MVYLDIHQSGGPFDRRAYQPELLGVIQRNAEEIT